MRNEVDRQDMDGDSHRMCEPNYPANPFTFHPLFPISIRGMGEGRYGYGVKLGFVDKHEKQFGFSFNICMYVSVSLYSKHYTHLNYTSKIHILYVLLN